VIKIYGRPSEKRVFFLGLNVLEIRNALAQMETASCCPGVRDNRYSVQLELAPENEPNILK
jgi:hypothetical protein